VKDYNESHVSSWTIAMLASCIFEQLQQESCSSITHLAPNPLGPDLHFDSYDSATDHGLRSATSMFVMLKVPRHLQSNDMGKHRGS
jgi:hypothetical protein